VALAFLLFSVGTLLLGIALYPAYGVNPPLGTETGFPKTHIRRFQLTKTRQQVRKDFAPPTEVYIKFSFNCRGREWSGERRGPCAQYITLKDKRGKEKTRKLPIWQTTRKQKNLKELSDVQITAHGRG
jgi:hypothetical protein